MTHIEGEASFKSAHEIEVNGQTIYGEKFVIATGSTANVPRIEGLQETGFLTHIEALQVKTLPKRLLIIGAGPLGLEFAQMYNNFGSKVNVLVRGEQILPKTEPDIAYALGNYLSRDGITIWTKAQALKVAKEGEDKVVTAEIRGDQMEFRVDEILVASGKTPNTSKLNLEAVGVQLSEGKVIQVSDFYQTSAEYIFAAGDVINKPLRLETTAGKEGTYAAENALKGIKKSVNYQHVPYAVFTSPSVAGVGSTDADVVASGGKCICKTVEFSEVPKAHIIKDTRGVIKMVVEGEEKKIVGVHMVAPQAADIIKADMTIDDVLETLPVFPTLSEAIKIVAMSFKTDVTKLSCCI